MENFTPYTSLIGGVLIGISSLWLLIANGKIAGVSGILERSLFVWQGLKNRYWAIWFIIGLVIGGEIVLVSNYPGFGFTHPHGLWTVIVGGILVGFGSRLGSGCTSGHGICGMGRLSLRSIVAVITFMLTAFLTLAVKRFLL